MSHQFRQYIVRAEIKTATNGKRYFKATTATNRRTKDDSDTDFLPVAAFGVGSTTCAISKAISPMPTGRPDIDILGDNKRLSLNCREENLAPRQGARSPYAASPASGRSQWHRTCSARSSRDCSSAHYLGAGDADGSRYYQAFNSHKATQSHWVHVPRTTALRLGDTTHPSDHSRRTLFPNVRTLSKRATM